MEIPRMRTMAVITALTLRGAIAGDRIAVEMK